MLEVVRLGASYSTAIQNMRLKRFYKLDMLRNINKYIILLLLLPTNEATNVNLSQYKKNKPLVKGEGHDW